MMHPDQLTVTTGVVTALVAEQFPGWAGLPVREVRSQGTDNALFRLGDRLAAGSRSGLTTRPGRSGGSSCPTMAFVGRRTLDRLLQASGDRPGA